MEKEIMDKDNVKNVAKTILYIINNQKTKMNFSEQVLKYYLYLVHKKYRELYHKDLFKVIYSKESLLQDFDYFLYTLKDLDMIEINKDGMFTIIIPKVKINENGYSHQERIAMNIVLDKYQYYRGIDLHEIVYSDVKKHLS